MRHFLDSIIDELYCKECGVGIKDNKVNFYVVFEESQPLFYDEESGTIEVDFCNSEYLKEVYCTDCGSIIWEK